VKKYRKSIYICQSYYQTSSGFFWDAVYNGWNGTTQLHDSITQTWSWVHFL